MKELLALGGSCRCQVTHPENEGMHRHPAPRNGILQGCAAGKENRREPQTPGLCPACPASYAGHKAVFQTLQFIKCEKSPSLNHSTELPVQAAGFMEKEQESSASSSMEKMSLVYGITPHLAEQNCYQMWPCSGLGISDKLKGAVQDAKWYKTHGICSFSFLPSIQYCIYRG